jgi:hypothetical protein
MDDPKAPQNRLISQVERIESPDGPAYGFSLLDEETLAPCFRLAFESREDAEQGREMMKEIIAHCAWFDVPEIPQAPSGSTWGKKWN